MSLLFRRGSKLLISGIPIGANLYHQMDLQNPIREKIDQGFQKMASKVTTLPSIGVALLSVKDLSKNYQFKDPIRNQLHELVPYGSGEKDEMELHEKHFLHNVNVVLDQHKVPLTENMKKIFEECFQRLKSCSSLQDQMRVRRENEIIISKGFREEGELSGSFMHLINSAAAPAMFAALKIAREEAPAHIHKEGVAPV